MNRKYMKKHRTMNAVVYVYYGLPPAYRAFVREFQAKLDGMQVVDIDALLSENNVIPFRPRGSQ